MFQGTVGRLSVCKFLVQDRCSEKVTFKQGFEGRDNGVNPEVGACQECSTKFKEASIA